METFLPILIWGGLLFLMMRFGCGAHMFGHGHGHKAGKAERHDHASHADQAKTLLAGKSPVRCVPARGPVRSRALVPVFALW